MPIAVHRELHPPLSSNVKDTINLDVARFALEFEVMAVKNVENGL